MKPLKTELRFDTFLIDQGWYKQDKKVSNKCWFKTKNIFMTSNLRVFNIINNVETFLLKIK